MAGLRQCIHKRTSLWNFSPSRLCVSILVLTPWLAFSQKAWSQEVPAEAETPIAAEAAAPAAGDELSVNHAVSSSAQATE